MPVLVDCRADDAQLNVSAVEAACTEKTKAVIASHLQGGLVDMPALREIADRRGIAIIEDVCQVPGAVVAGRPAGAWGDVATLSFGGSKLVTAGRGGAVLTSRAEIAQRIKLYTQRGNEAYPLSEMQAALLLPQWELLEQDHAVRAKVVAELCDLPSIVAFRSAKDRSFAERKATVPVYYKLGFWYDATKDARGCRVIVSVGRCGPKGSLLIRVSRVCIRSTPVAGFEPAVNSHKRRGPVPVLSCSTIHCSL